MIGAEIHKFAKQLWPLNRSLTGEGVRKTLNKIQMHLPKMRIHSVASGTKIFDWTIPKEWHVREAFIVTPNGEKICDFSENNLHLLGYSVPFEGVLSLSELKKNFIHCQNSQMLFHMSQVIMKKDGAFAYHKIN